MLATEAEMLAEALPVSVKDTVPAAPKLLTSNLVTADAETPLDPVLALIKAATSFAESAAVTAIVAEPRWPLTVRSAPEIDCVAAPVAGQRLQQ